MITMLPDHVSPAELSWAGPAAESLARLAARQAFCELKASFMRAATDIDGAPGERLRWQVGLTTQAIELWRLQPQILDALPVQHQHSQGHRTELLRQTGLLFPEYTD